MSDDSLTRRVRATLTIELEYDLDSRVSIDRFKRAVNKIAGDASSYGLFLTADIGYETSVASWSSKVECPDEGTETGPGASPRVSLDGGSSWQPAREGVRVLYSGLELEDGKTADVLLNHTHEGLITDIIVEDKVHATESSPIGEFLFRLY